MRRTKLVVLGSLVAALALASPSSARAEADAAEHPASFRAWDTRHRYWQAEAGVRVGKIRDAGYDPFATDDALVATTIGASRTVFQRGQLTIAPGIAWDYSESNASARGASSRLVVHRLAATAEIRWHFLPILYGFAKLAPGALHGAATLDDSSSRTQLGDGFWSFSLDESAGAAFLVTPEDEPHVEQVRLWVTAEAGYGYVSRHDVVLRPDVPDEQASRYGGVALGSLALRGPFLRVAAAVTY